MPATRPKSLSRVATALLFLPALITGFVLAFARAVGEYGSVIFIAGNIPLVTEIAPLLGKSYAATRQRLVRLRQILKQRMEEQGYGR